MPIDRRCLGCSAALVAVLVSLPGRLLAQSKVPPADAAAVIRAADIARHVAVIADDSMGGRDTPSRGLERTAAYVADQFRALGLAPLGDFGAKNDERGVPVDTSWFQRYPIPGRLKLDYAASQLNF